MGVLVREVAALYAAFRAGLPSPLPELPIQYADFAVWQRGWLGGEGLEREIAYWRERLGRRRPRSSCRPTGRGRGGRRSAARSRRFDLPAELAEGLAALGRREGATLFMTALAAFRSLLHRFARRRTSPSARRSPTGPRREMEGLIGFFVNTLALRSDASGDPGVPRAARAGRAGGARRLRATRTCRSSGWSRSCSRSASSRGRRSSRSCSRCRTRAAEARSSCRGSSWRRWTLPAATAKFDLTLSLAEEPAGLGGTASSYNLDLFDPATIDAAGRATSGILLAGMPGVAGPPVSELPLLTPAERQQSGGLERTSAPLPRERGLHRLFAEQAARTPEAVAVVFGEERLSYRGARPPRPTAWRTACAGWEPGRR